MARLERIYFRFVARTQTHSPLYTIKREDGSPSLWRQMMDLRRKAQRQGHVTIEPDEARKAQLRMKRHLAEGAPT